MRYSEVMDVLVEMSPGSGWLAREGDRIVFVPTAESVDTAHDVIEPLLIPRDIDDSFATLTEWISEGVPLPPMLLISLEESVRLLANNIDELFATATPEHDIERVVTAASPEIVEVGKVANLIVHDDADEASGMLVEGVVRAGGLRLHFHRGWDSPQSENAFPSSFLEIALGDRRVVVGNGLVIGRWPYSHPDFDEDPEVLVLIDPAVSRLRALSTPSAEGAMLDDQDSHNGTWIVRESGESIRITSESPQVITSGDQLRIGDTMLTVL